MKDASQKLLPLYTQENSGQVIDLGAALMKQVKTAANRGVQHYQHWLYATFWQDNPVAEGYLG